MNRTRPAIVYSPINNKFDNNESLPKIGKRDDYYKNQIHKRRR